MEFDGANETKLASANQHNSAAVLNTQPLEKDHRSC
jgi:hypothetical protein